MKRDKADMWQKIHKVLLKNWDPIGIGDVMEANDEYDAYVQPIYDLIIRQGSKSEMFDLLWWIETEHMGLDGDRLHTHQVVEKLWEIRGSINNSNAI